MKQVGAAFVCAFFFFSYGLVVASAEGEIPAIPLEDQEVAAVSIDGQQLDQIPQTSTNVPGEKAVGESLQPPALETWRPIVESLRPGYWEASVLPLHGVAMYYNPGVFQRVLDFRYQHSHITECEECIGYVALLRAGDIDRRVWLKRQDRIAEGPFWVVDVAARKDIPGLLSRNWVVDIDYKTAMRWRMAGPISIVVYAADSPEAMEAATAYFASEMIPLDERHIIPPEAYSYRGLDDEIEWERDVPSLQLGSAVQWHIERR